MDEVNQSPGSCNQNLNSPKQRTSLIVLFDASVDACPGNSAFRQELLKLVLNLHGQLSGRGQYQNRCFSAVSIGMIKQVNDSGYEEGEGLARPRLRNTNEVSAAHNDWHALSLDWSECLEAIGHDGVVDDLRQFGYVEGEEGLWWVINIFENDTVLLSILSSSGRYWAGLYGRCFFLNVVGGSALRGLLSKLHVLVAFNLSIMTIISDYTLQRTS